MEIQIIKMTFQVLKVLAQVDLEIDELRLRG